MLVVFFFLKKRSKTSKKKDLGAKLKNKEVISSCRQIINVLKIKQYKNCYDKYITSDDDNNKYHLNPATLSTGISIGILFFLKIM